MFGHSLSQILGLLAFRELCWINLGWLLFPRHGYYTRHVFLGEDFYAASRTNFFSPIELESNPNFTQLYLNYNQIWTYLAKTSTAHGKEHLLWKRSMRSICAGCSPCIALLLCGNIREAWQRGLRNSALCQVNYPGFRHATAQHPHFYGDIKISMIIKMSSCQRTQKQSDQEIVNRWQYSLVPRKTRKLIYIATPTRILHVAV